MCLEALQIVDSVSYMRNLINDAHKARSIVRLLKVGDKVFFTGHGMMEELTVHSIESHEKCNNNDVMFVLRRDDETTEEISDKDFGEDAFLTFEEAVKALEEQKGDNENDTRKSDRNSRPGNKRGNDEEDPLEQKYAYRPRGM